VDRTGWLEVCRPLGTVFLDEIGDLDPSIQVKLLRVLQTRTFQRIGDTADRTFAGKIIAATNVDLPTAMRDGRLREDFYYRLAADRIQTPFLRDQLKDQPDDLRLIVYHLLRRIVGDEAESLADEMVEVIARDVPADYGWPGNVRELEQCVRNVMIRRCYYPPQTADRSPGRRLAEAMEAGRFTADQLLDQYCGLVYERTGSYVETARRVGLDRRTVRARVERSSQNGMNDL
jgi:transcriptional regulator with PAS, ATPase and Fis domain